MPEPPNSKPVAPRHDPSAEDRNRSTALNTACDDLQAQLEAGDRSLRHVDRDVTLLREAITTAVCQTEMMGDLSRHLHELRDNMREQRAALREVRRAANRLCTAMSETRDCMETLVEQKLALERTHTALRSEHARLHETPRDRAGHEAHGEHLRDHLSDLREFRRRLPAGEASDGDQKG